MYDEAPWGGSEAELAASMEADDAVLARVRGRDDWRALLDRPDLLTRALDAYDLSAAEAEWLGGAVCARLETWLAGDLTAHSAESAKQLADAVVRLDAEAGAFAERIEGLVDGFTQATRSHWPAQLRDSTLVGGAALALVSSPRMASPDRLKTLLQYARQEPELLERLVENPGIEPEGLRLGLETYRGAMVREQAEGLLRRAQAKGREDLVCEMAGPRHGELQHAFARHASPALFQQVVERPDKDRTWWMTALNVRLKHGASTTLSWPYIEQALGWCIARGTPVARALEACTQPNEKLLELLLAHEDRAVRMKAITAMQAARDPEGRGRSR